MTPEELDNIRSWDKRCGDNEATFFPVTIDRRRLLQYVDELRAELAALTGAGPPATPKATAAYCQPGRDPRGGA
jgi:hypothetical protein